MKINIIDKREDIQLTKYKDLDAGDVFVCECKTYIKEVGGNAVMLCSGDNIPLDSDIKVEKVRTELIVKRMYG